MRNRLAAPASPSDDRALVDLCIAGEPQGWTLLYQHCHNHLVKTIRLLIGRSAADLDLVDEIAARVWYALVHNQGELLSRFDPLRGCRLTTFLSILAKSEARQYFRSERRRRAREEAASRRSTAHQLEDLGLLLDTEGQFIESLTPAELKYFRCVLVGSAEVTASYTDRNSWQLRHRVRNKMIRFLDGME